MSTEHSIPEGAQGDLATGLNSLAGVFPEINPSNYEHDDACALNTWGCEAVGALRGAADHLAALVAENHRMRAELQHVRAVAWQAQADGAMVNPADLAMPAALPHPSQDTVLGKKGDPYCPVCDQWREGCSSCAALEQPK